MTSMTEKLRRRKAAEAASLSRMGTAILKGDRLAVAWLPDNSPEIGYTAMGKPTTVHVLWENDEFTKDMDEPHRAMFRMGVFAHELLHQCFTAFDYTNNIARKMSRAESAIFMNFANTLEDPAIEYFAPTIFGGRLLEALRYMIRTIYALSPGIDKSGSAFSQLINALVQFGDMGIIKGKFTFPEARKYFDIVAPVYNTGITCPNAEKRIDIAKECMEITRPLWEEEVKKEEEFKKLLEELAKALGMSGSPKFRPEGDGEGEGSPKKSSDPASERRKEILKKIAEAAAKKAKRESEDAEEGEGMTVSTSEDAEAEKKSKSSKTSSGSFAGSKTSKEEEEGEGKDGSSDSSEGKEAEEGESGEMSVSSEGSESEAKSEDENEESTGVSAKDSTSADSSESSSKKGEENDGKPEDDADADCSDDITSDEATANEEVAEEVDDKTLDEIETSIESEEKAIAKKEAEDGENEAPMELPDFDISTIGKLKGKSTCLNRRPISRLSQVELVELYKAYTEEYAWEIKGLTKTLDKIFEADKEEQHRATSGTYNIKRGSIGTSAKMFDKRRDPGNRKDVAVCLCVDQSGSMSNGTRIKNARKTAIVLAEALTKLKVPYYVMGFTADVGADAVHNHFVDWKNRKQDRETLAGMNAGGNNFDGYSIRYATELLRARRECNKILFVISDGEPACRTYRSMRDGLSDTITAIKDARKSAMTVFGIAIGNGCSPALLQSMYGKDFIAVEDESSLTNVFAKKLAKTIK